MRGAHFKKNRSAGGQLAAFFAPPLHERGDIEQVSAEAPVLLEGGVRLFDDIEVGVGLDRADQGVGGVEVAAPGEEESGLGPGFPVLVLVEEELDLVDCGEVALRGQAGVAEDLGGRDAVVLGAVALEVELLDAEGLGDGRRSSARPGRGRGPLSKSPRRRSGSPRRSRRRRISRAGSGPGGPRVLSGTGRARRPRCRASFPPVPPGSAESRGFLDRWPPSLSNSPFRPDLPDPDPPARWVDPGVWR